MATSKELQKESQDVKPTAEGKQEQNTTEKPATKEKASKPRHRASVACASCRDRRIRCVVLPGQTECTQCKRSGVECVIKNDDERRRPISRAYMCSLTERVALLETMLKEQGQEPPPANHPPKTRHQRNDEASPNRKTSDAQAAQNDNSSPGSQSSPQEDYNYPEFENAEQHTSPRADTESTGSPSMLPPPKKDGMVSRLLSTRGHLSFDQLSGRLRYFGPTTNCHVHSESGNPMDSALEQTEQARRADKIIRSLPLETYDYLMDLFWQCYNPVIHVLHQEAFNEDREAGRTQFYSGFLHVCVLAMGYRSADKNRPDIKRISLGGQESTLHREAKYMLDHELERPGGIPSVVALLLLGDLECGVGRDNLGWLYAGLAVRLAFDIGLHLDTRLSGLPEREVQIRQMTLWACVIYDKYWALFLGRPTSMKSSDLEIYHLSKQFERLGTCRPAGPEKSMETMIYEALIDLMELAGKITENMDPHFKNSDSPIDRNQYMRMAALDREFSSWYARLPEQLRWTPNNIATAPFSFFLLHQQYHASLILLHRPFALYEDQSTMGSETNGPDDHFSTLSRTVCTKHAIRVARIFWQHRQRFDTKQIFVTGMQHAGTAATALVAALAFIKDSTDRNNNMQYLECLSAALSDMAHTYVPAERMSVVLRAVMIELRGGPEPNQFRLYKPKSALVPARRGSEHDADDAAVWKKRQTSRPRAGTGGGRKPRTSSMSATTMSIPGLEQSTSLSITAPPPPPPPPPPRFAEDPDRTDGFILVTPRDDLSMWPPIDPPELVHNTLSTPSTTTTTISTSLPSTHHAGNNNQHRDSGAWMGATPSTEFDTSDPISQLANVHFPEMGHFDAAESIEGMTNLDFMALGGEGDWGLGKEWASSGGGGGTDLDGFPSVHGNGFTAGMGFGSDKFGF